MPLSLKTDSSLKLYMHVLFHYYSKPFLGVEGGVGGIFHENLCSMCPPLHWVGRLALRATWTFHSHCCSLNTFRWHSLCTEPRFSHPVQKARRGKCHFKIFVLFHLLKLFHSLNCSAVSAAVPAVFASPTFFFSPIFSFLLICVGYLYSLHIIFLASALLLLSSASKSICCSFLPPFQSSHLFILHPRLVRLTSSLVSVLFLVFLGLKLRIYIYTVPFNKTLDNMFFLQPFDQDDLSTLWARAPLSVINQPLCLTGPIFLVVPRALWCNQMPCNMTAFAESKLNLPAMHQWKHC